MKHKKYIYCLLTIILIGSACGHRTSYPQQILLKNNIMEVIDSLVNKYDDYPLYELYIDKIDPHNVIMIMYAGYKSLTEEENNDYNQKPLFYTITSNNKRVIIFSGIERYILSNNNYQYSKPNNSNDNFGSISWTIRDSMGIFTIDSIYGVYPFFPLPLKFDVPKMEIIDDTTS